MYMGEQTIHTYFMKQQHDTHILESIFNDTSHIYPDSKTAFCQQLQTNIILSKFEFIIFIFLASKGFSAEIKKETSPKNLFKLQQSQGIDQVSIKCQPSVCIFQIKSTKFESSLYCFIRNLATVH